MEKQALPKDTLDFSQPWEFSDAILIVEDKIFNVHRSILSMWSPVFSRMFTADFKEKSTQVVSLPEKKSSEIKEMLLVIYPTSGKQINGENYSLLLDLAKEYMMKKLTDKCEEYLMNCLSSPSQSLPGSFSCLNLLVIAQEYDLVRLQAKCIEQAQNMSFKELKKDELYDKINISSYRKIVEGMMESKERELQELRNKHSQVKRNASDALDKFETIVAVLIEMINDTRDNKGYINTLPLYNKLIFICNGGGRFAHLRFPLRDLHGYLNAIKQS